MKLPQDPMSLFGSLLTSCVSDDYQKERRLMFEGALVMVLGVASSVATAYLLSAAGVLL